MSNPRPDRDLAEAPPEPERRLGGFALTRPPRWAKSIGVICIFVAALGLITGPGSIIVAVRSGELDLEAMLGNLIGVGLSIFLLLGGINLLRVRSSARSLLLTYAYIAGAVAIVNVARVLTGADFASLAEATQREQLTAALYVTATLVTPLFPLFLIIWFWRRPIRRQMARWR